MQSFWYTSLRSVFCPESALEMTGDEKIAFEGSAPLHSATSQPSMTKPYFVNPVLVQEVSKVFGPGA